MSFINRLKTGFEVIEVQAKKDFSETFELDKEIAAFLQEYDLWDDVEAIAHAALLTDKERAKKSQQSSDVLKFQGKDGKVPEPPKKTKSFLKFPLDSQLRLTKKTQTELARSYKLFTSHMYAEKRFTDFKAGIAREINDIIKEVAKKIKREPRGIHVTIDMNDDESYVGEGAVGCTINIKYKGETLKLEPEGLYYKADTGAVLSDAMESYHWAAWLGDERSPFEDSSWRDAYLYDQASSWFAEAGSIESDEDSIRAKIKSLILKAEEEN